MVMYESKHAEVFLSELTVIKMADIFNIVREIDKRVLK